jgi:hypothetical protein
VRELPAGSAWSVRSFLQAAQGGSAPAQGLGADACAYLPYQQGEDAGDTKIGANVCLQPASDRFADREALTYRAAGMSRAPGQASRCPRPVFFSQSLCSKLSRLCDRPADDGVTAVA